MNDEIQNKPIPPKDNVDTRNVSEIFKSSDVKPENVSENSTAKAEQHMEGNTMPVENKTGGRLITFLLDLALNLLIVFGLVYVIQTFIASPFKVYGPSMCDTLNNIEDACMTGYGEYIIVNKLIYKDFFGWSLSEPQRGDIIVFHPPHTNKQFYIKRIIGLPGDTVKLIDGKVYIFNDEYPTGRELKEDYLNKNNLGNTNPSTSNRVTSFTVGEDEYFVLGDNRMQSVDSRSCFRDPFQGGCRGEEQYFLPKKNISGKAWVVLWPIQYVRTIDEPNYK